jgi:LruC domain-containing protein
MNRGPHRLERLCITLLMLAISAPALAAPVTNPNDTRNWQGATIGTFAALIYGTDNATTRQNLINAGTLDDGIFPNCVAANFTGPTANPCASYTNCMNHATLIQASWSGLGGCTGYSYSPTSWAYTCGTTSFARKQEAARCLDMWWMQDVGDGPDGSGDIWDLGGPSNQVAVFPTIDHGPMPQEAIEYSVYLSNNPNATTTGTNGNTQWVLAALDKVYLEGWINTWIADGFTTVWRLPNQQTFRYVMVVAGGPGALLRDSDDELDTVVGLTFGGQQVCPGSSDGDGDGVCDDTDNCIAVANPIQEDADNDMVGSACDPNPNDPEICGDADNDGRDDCAPPDTDNDGVPDRSDTFPCDPQTSAATYLPAEGSFGMVQYEDLWPESYDLDFNDAVVAWNYVYMQNASGGVKAMRVTLNILALGGFLEQGLGLQLPVSTNSVESITRTVGHIGAPVALTPRSTDANLTVDISSDLRPEVFPGTQPNEIINSKPGTPTITGHVVELYITFRSHVVLALGSAPHDLFIFRPGARGHEVHRPEFCGTAAMSSGLFGTGIDGSAIGQRCYVDRTGLPMALVMPMIVPYPPEEVPIHTLYPNIVTFASSGGTQNQNFYLSPVSGVGYSTPLAPTFPFGPSLAADRSCIAPAP